MNKKLILEVGKKFGKWEIISSETIRKNNLTHWLCKCSCGSEEYVPLNNLMNGSSKQCKKCSTKESGIKRRKGIGLISGDYWSQIKNKAKIKGHKFDIRIEEAWELFKEQYGLCGLTNMKINLTGYPYNKNETTAILALINNKNGYVKGNVVWIHKDVDHIKRDLTLEELYDIAEKIVNG